MILLIGCICLLLGYAGGVVTTIRLMYWVPKYQKIIQQLLSDAYHENLLPEVCRLEGLLRVALVEAKMGTHATIPYIEMCLDVILKHKEKIKSALEKYHKWQ